MIKKVVIVGLVLASFLFVSTFSVCATDEEQSFEDPEYDVLNVNEEPTDTRPNIDITNISYVKEGKEVTLTLKVKGTIEDRGDIEDEESSNLVVYTIDLYTSHHDYSIMYINGSCDFSIDEETDELTDFSSSGGTLTFIFDLKSQDGEDETYSSLQVYTYDMHLLNIYADEFSDMAGEELEVQISAPSTGKVGQSLSFSSSVTGGTSPYEYEWYFDDDFDIDSTVENPTHTFSEAGKYNITLVVNDSTGNYGYDEAKITITSSGTPGGSTTDDSSSDSGLIPFIVLVVVIVVAGIAVVVYVMRR